jgi:hypothetical protein
MTSLNGGDDVAAITAVINSTLNGVRACYFQYQVAGNLLSLANDAATEATVGTLGAPGALSNSQCQINLGASSATRTGSSLTFTVEITFKTNLFGTQNTYLMTTTTGGVASAWQQIGTWTAR